MSAAIGAALKKIAAALLTDKKVLKTVCGIILGVLIIIFIPVFTMLALFHGSADLDIESMKEMMMENLSQEQKDRIRLVQETMDGIETVMRASGFSDARINEAQMLYSMALEEQASDPEFITTLVGLFEDGQTDEELVARVNETFGVEISVTEFVMMMTPVRIKYPDTEETETTQSMVAGTIEGG